MDNSQASRTIYCFDTSTFAALNRINNSIIKLPDDLWSSFEQMMKDGEIISHVTVFKEFFAKGNNDFLTKWVSDKKRYFYEKTDFQIKEVSKIISKYPSLIDPSSEREQADPWLIALAIEKTGNNGLFECNNCVVVSQESPSATQKIPAVCKGFSIRHISLKDFFEEVGISTYITKSRTSK